MARPAQQGACDGRDIHLAVGAQRFGRPEGQASAGRIADDTDRREGQPVLRRIRGCDMRFHVDGRRSGFGPQASFRHRVEHGSIDPRHVAELHPRPAALED